MILLISPEPWNAHSVSKHHYAITLASEGYRVLFLDPPDPRYREITLEAVEGCLGIQRVRASRVAPGLRWLPSPMRRWFEARWLHQLECLIGSPINVIWLFENSRFYDLRFAGSRLKIYHQVDLNQSFHPETAARTADVCFCSTELIRQRLLPYNSRCHRLQHGVDLSHPPAALSATEQRRFIPGKVHAMYVGNLEMAYLDLKLLAEVIEQHPDVRFHLVGGYRSDGALFKLLSHVSNVVWWGKVVSSQIPSLLAQADLLMVCYLAKHHADQANPHKMMEYLASGRTVVATYTAEFAVHDHLLAMSGPHSNHGYSSLFASVLANIKTWNSADRTSARQFFAENHSYSNQLQHVINYLISYNLLLKFN